MADQPIQGVGRGSRPLTPGQHWHLAGRREHEVADAGNAPDNSVGAVRVTARETDPADTLPLDFFFRLRSETHTHLPTAPVTMSAHIATGVGVGVAPSSLTPQLRTETGGSSFGVLCRCPLYDTDGTHSCGWWMRPASTAKTLRIRADTARDDTKCAERYAFAPAMGTPAPRDITPGDRRVKHPKAVSERRGHSRIGITLDTYSYVLPNMQETAAQAIERAIAG